MYHFLYKKFLNRKLFNGKKWQTQIENATNFKILKSMSLRVDSRDITHKLIPHI